MRVPIAEVMEILAERGFTSTYHGSDAAFITQFCPLSAPQPHALTWVRDVAAFHRNPLDPDLGTVIIAAEPLDEQAGFNTICTPDPRAAFFSIISGLNPQPAEPFIAPNATVLARDLPHDLRVGYHTFIDEHVTIGRGTRIGHNVTIQNSVVIGEDCVIESGAVIGAPGFGYFENPAGRMEKIPDLGGIVIGDRVSIGANAVVSRGTLGQTIIGDDSKIDILAYIAHNVVIGPGCVVVGAAMLSGSARLGERVYVAPAATVIDHADIGDEAFIGMGSVVMHDVAAHTVVAGVPARFLRDR